MCIFILDVCKMMFVVFACHVYHSISMMSYSEKPEDITKEEWLDKLNNVHIQRADMNRLIMNYLVTGMSALFYSIVQYLIQVK